jgi:hypothetical protein
MLQQAVSPEKVNVYVAHDVVILKTQRQRIATRVKSEAIQKGDCQHRGLNRRCVGKLMLSNLQPLDRKLWIPGSRSVVCRSFLGPGL